MARALILAALLLAPQNAAVKEVRDVAYYDGKDADARKHKLDLYLPTSDKPFPILMWIHGGGWYMGDRALFRDLGRRLAERGIGCAAISYRLSPGVKHPEHVKDCARAFAWLHANAKKHGGDPDRLFVSGHSAGGHLAALLTLDPKYLQDLKVPEGAIKGAIPMSGVYTIPALKEDIQGLMKMFPAAFGSDAESCRDASPTTHAAKAKIPMLVITETMDSMGGLRESMALFKASLAGFKDVTFLDAEDRNHITIVMQMARAAPDPARDAIVDFIKKRCDLIK